MTELASLVSGAIAWVLVFVCFAASLVALAKLRITPAGLSLGLGFFGVGLSRLSSKLYRLLVVGPALEEARMSHVDTNEVFTAVFSVFSCVNIGNAFLVLAIGLGAALVPYSLKRLPARGAKKVS